MKLTNKFKELLNKFSNTQIALRDPAKPYAEAGVPIGDMFEEIYESLGDQSDSISDVGSDLALLQLEVESNLLVAKSAVYDFETMGGAIGTIDLGLVIPEDAIILRAYTQMLETFGSDDLAEVSISVNGTELKAAAAFDNAAYTGVKAITVASPILMAADGEVNIGITVADLTAGKMKIIIEYLVG